LPIKRTTYISIHYNIQKSYFKTHPSGGVRDAGSFLYSSQRLGLKPHVKPSRTDRRLVWKLG
jgi:hypothetical protein